MSSVVEKPLKCNDSVKEYQYGSHQNKKKN
jgi:hypothetical protein